MHRIDSSGNVDNRFHPGNPATGQQATLVTADILNAFQEEIAGVIEDAGIVLDKADNTQLAAAITALIAGVVGDGSGAVPTTRQISTSGGLLTGGGTLAADRTIGLVAASVAEVAAQTATNVVATPASLAGLVGLSVTGSNWVITLGQTIIQIFTGTASGNSTSVLTLPQAFPTQCRAAWANGGAIDTDAQDNFPYVSGVGTTSISVFNARGTSVPVNILAIGR